MLARGMSQPQASALDYTAMGGTRTTVNTHGLIVTLPMTDRDVALLEQPLRLQDRHVKRNGFKTFNDIQQMKADITCQSTAGSQRHLSQIIKLF